MRVDPRSLGVSDVIKGWLAGCDITVEVTVKSDRPSDSYQA
jgi:hypothetical protein